MSEASFSARAFGIGALQGAAPLTRGSTFLFRELSFTMSFASLRKNATAFVLM